jgi:uncharacterized membrane protein YcaP (DUF421 family)
MSLIILRSVLLYFITLLAMRAMGKRQLGQLQPFEFVIIIIISEMASLAMQSNTVPILTSVAPILTLTLLQISLSLLNLKCPALRAIICGKPTLLMSNGVLQRQQMRKLRLNLNDLLELTRVQGYFDLSALHTIVMESGGQLSVFPRTGSQPASADDVDLHLPQKLPGELYVLDGRVNRAALKARGKNMAGLEKQLKEAKIDDVAELFYAGADSAGKFFYQKLSQNKE